MARRRPIVILFVPVPVILLCCLLEVLGATRRVGDRFYDLSLRLEPAPPVARELLLVDIDDRAIATAGVWPWSRDVLADGLLLMKELDARYAVFDTPFSGRAPLGVDRQMLREKLPSDLDAEMARIEENVSTLFDAIRRGSVRPADSPRYVSELTGLIAASKERLLEEVAHVERDSDLYLGRTFRLFGRAFVAVELDASRGATVPSMAELASVEHFALSDVSTAGLAPLWTRSFLLPTPSIAQGARGGGYRDNPVDADGVIRRSRVAATFQDYAVGHVAFAAALDRIGLPAVSITEEGIALDRMETRSMPSRLLTIPLTPEGEVLIDWPRSRGQEAVRRLSWQELHQHGQLEADLAAALGEMDRSGYLAYYRAEASALELYVRASSIRDEILSSGVDSGVAEWREAREQFLALTAASITDDIEQRIVADAKRGLGQKGPTEEEKAAFQRTTERAPELFREARRDFAELTRLRASLRQSLAGSFCVVSVTGSSATVLGTTSRGEPCTSGEVSAALVNAILTGRFFRSLPRWYATAAAALLGLAVAAALIRARPLASFVVGVGLASAICLTAMLVQVVGRIVVDPTSPAGCVLLVSVAVAAVKVRQDHLERADW